MPLPALLLPLCILAQDGGMQPRVPDDSAAAQELARLVSNAGDSWNTEIHGYIKSSYGWSNDVGIYAPGEYGGFSLDALRLSIDSDIEGWRLHVGLRGESFNGQGFFGVSGSTGPLRTTETIASRELFPNFWFSIGKFRPPFVSSALYEENELLFANRSFIGSEWNRYDNGAMLTGRVGAFSAWLAVQNGDDAHGADVATTVHAMWDVIGAGAGQDWEGAWNAADRFNLSVGGAVYYDSESAAVSAEAIEVHGTLERFYFGLEVVDNGDGLGDLYSWAVTGSFRITHDVEAAVRLEDFDRDDSTDLVRLGINYFIDGHRTKFQASVADADSNAPLADATVFQAAFVTSF